MSKTVNDDKARDIGHKAPNMRLKAPASSNPKTKLHIGFDVGQRKTYLKGFSERKVY
jgi:hypothetical protein